MIYIRLILLNALFLPLTVSSQSAEQNKSTKPNIIFILVDDFGWNQVGSYGCEIVNTPNLDKLVLEGAKFTSAYAMPQCSPTRAAFLSGKYPARSVVDVYQQAPLFRSLRDADRLKGKCGACEFRNACGGSRARAFAVTGDPLAAEPDCVYQPRLDARAHGRATRQRTASCSA